MAIETSRQGASSLIEIDGAFSKESCDRLLATTRGEIEAGARLITLDMSAVDSIRDDGLFALMQACKIARRHGGIINIAQPSDAAREALALSELDQLIRVFDSRAEAIAYP